MRAFVLSLALLAATPALAQFGSLPAESRSEGQIQDTNRALLNRELQRGREQQNQFEINSLRNEIQRQQMFPPPGRLCAPGQVTC